MEQAQVIVQCLTRFFFVPITVFGTIARGKTNSHSAQIASAKLSGRRGGQHAILAAALSRLQPLLQHSNRRRCDR